MHYHAREDGVVSAWKSQFRLMVPFGHYHNRIELSIGHLEQGSGCKTGGRTAVAQMVTSLKVTERRIPE